MGRQIEAGARPRAGTGSAGRLDPFALPVQFAAPDAAADGGVRRVTLESGRVVVDRMVRSVTMRIAVPVSSFSGVVVRLAPAERPEADRIEVVLAHRDRALDVPLHEGSREGDGIAEWRSWARALKLPLLVEEADGRRCATQPTLGGVQVGRPRPRRRHSLLAGRRTRFASKRKTGKLTAATPVARGEREIIARN